MDQNKKEASILTSIVVFGICYIAGVLVAEIITDGYYYITNKKRPTDGSNY